ncbi:hypothetical protein PYW07_015946 [Mythimna separata]|uniref:Uncharacterized protein n=1 Tax=Mythimna separata TaxID=271217 RepID=A0AAD7YR10_MYTSE|nr:hypothetical protein PYW07_015946 [Mythimna separata]
MLFGTIKKLLSSEYNEFDGTILVESPFAEITRDGKVILRLVQLGLNSKAFIIASERDITGKDASTSDGTPLCRESSVIEILSLYPWESIRLTIFKTSQRQVLKATFINDGVRYFELRDIPKKKIFWSIWCSCIKELHCSDKKWPFSLSTQVDTRKKEFRVAECIELRFIKHTEKEKRFRWTDKYLYLGSTREEEDKIRPVPVPGLGRAEEINLYYLKPRYFGCWEQSEHWVQCGDSSLNTLITYSK